MKHKECAKRNTLEVEIYRNMYKRTRDLRKREFTIHSVKN